MKTINRYNDKGILFWITGLSGSGKTSLAKKIFPIIKKKYGPTVHLDGDSLRNILNLNGYSYNERLSNTKIYNKIVKLLTEQNINVIISLVGLMQEPRTWNRKHIKKYIEIYIKSEVKKIISKDKKKIYKKNKNVVGLSIKPEFPKSPEIMINNSFNKKLDYLKLVLLDKISIIVHKKKYK
jgi:adenylylsulfate kinase-like enzyme